MSLQAITTDKAPAAIGPYAQAVRAGGLLFVSGQLPLDPASGQIVDGDVRTQAARVLDNLEAILRAAGTGFTAVVRTDVFLTDLGDFAALNEVYAQRFTGLVKPARQTVQVSALPRGAKVEISCIASLARD